MDRLDAMRVFVEVADKQGFSAASKSLGLPLSTVSRKVSELEDHLGAQLLIRTTRQVEVTDSGWAYYQDAVNILDAVDAQERKASGEYEKPRGHLVITSPTMFGRQIMLPIAIAFMRSHPDITVRFQLSNSVFDLMSEHIDLGLRIGHLADSSQRARQAGVVHQIVCASPEYLRDRGRPTRPGNITSHQCITYSTSDTAKEWEFQTRQGKTIRQPVRPAIALNSVEGVVRAASMSAGLAMVYSYQVMDNIRNGELEIVLRDFEIEPLPVSFIYPQSRLLPQKVRAFIDFALPRLKGVLVPVSEELARPAT